MFGRVLNKPLLKPFESCIFVQESLQYVIIGSAIWLDFKLHTLTKSKGMKYCKYLEISGELHCSKTNGIKNSRSSISSTCDCLQHLLMVASSFVMLLHITV